MAPQGDKGDLRGSLPLVQRDVARDTKRRNMLLGRSTNHKQKTQKSRSTSLR
jgi:hypothetical protein